MKCQNVFCNFISIALINFNGHASVQSLRGPRGGMIFFKKDPVLGVELESAINNAVFPGLQVSSIFSHPLIFTLHFFICNLEC